MKYRAGHSKQLAKKWLGKIREVSFGTGGYQNAMFGLTVELESKSICCQDFISGGWYPGIIDPGKDTKWNEDDRVRNQAEMCNTVAHMLHTAGVEDVHELKGKPVEFITDSNMLQSWRILDEVL